MTLTLIISALFFAMLTAFAAGQRGRDAISWYFVGLVLGPIGMIAWLLPKVQLEPGLLFEQEPRIAA